MSENTQTNYMTATDLVAIIANPRAVIRQLRAENAALRARIGDLEDDPWVESATSDARPIVARDMLRKAESRIGALEEEVESLRAKLADAQETT